VDGNSLLHNSMIVIGGGNADGNRHTHVNLPIMLAGGGTLTTGRYVCFAIVSYTTSGGCRALIIARRVRAVRHATRTILLDIGPSLESHFS
jgi:hypothetical protein